MIINIKKFTINPYKYLSSFKEKLIITTRGKEAFIIRRAKDIEPIKRDVPTKTIENKVIKSKVPDIILRYGCGCKKTEEMLCKKHGRM